MLLVCIRCHRHVFGHSRLAARGVTGVAAARPTAADTATATATAAATAATAAAAAAAPLLPSESTPALRQYLRFKRDPQYANTVLLFQLGGFYEAFFADAPVVAHVCGIVLTAKAGVVHDGAPVPMAGIPIERPDGHIAKLLRRGVRVCLVEQTEGLLAQGRGGGGGSLSGGGADGFARAAYAASLHGAAARGRAVVPQLLGREVSRILTPGTSPEALGGSPLGHRYVAALAFGAPTLLSPPTAAEGARVALPLALAYCDLATGDLQVRRSDGASLGADLSSLGPVELIVPSARPEMGPSAGAPSAAVTLEAVLAALAAADGGSSRRRAAPRVPAAAILEDLVLQRALAASGGSAHAQLLPQAQHTALDARWSPAAVSGAASLPSRLVHDVARLCAVRLLQPGSGGSGGGDADAGCFVTFVSGADFSVRAGLRLCHELSGRAHAPAAVDADLGALSDLELAALGGLLSHMRWTHAGRLPRLSQPVAIGDLAAVPDSGGGAGGRPEGAAAADCGGVPLQSVAAAAAAATAAGGVLAAAPPQLGAFSGGAEPLPHETPRLHLAGRLHALLRPPPRMRINEVTQRALELVRPMHRHRRARGCLLALVDRCRTHMGSRLLDSRVCGPLAALEPILHRHDAVEAFLPPPHTRTPHLTKEEGALSASTRVLMRRAVLAACAAVPDLERCFQRIGAGGRPSARDLVTVWEGLRAAHRVGCLLGSWDPGAYDRAALRRGGSWPSSAPLAAAAAGGVADAAEAEAGRARTSFAPAAGLAIDAAVRARTAALAAGARAFGPALTHGGELSAFLLHAARLDFDVLRRPCTDAAASGPLEEALVLAQCAAVLTAPLDAAVADAVDAAAASHSVAGGVHCAQADADAVHALAARDSFEGLRSTFEELGRALAHAGEGDPAGGGAGGEDGGWGEGASVRPGYDAALDAARALALDTGTAQRTLEAHLREAMALPPGSPALRLRRLEKEGFVVEVDTKSRGVRAKLETLLAAHRTAEAEAAAAAAVVSAAAVAAHGPAADGPRRAKRPALSLSGAAPVPTLARPAALLPPGAADAVAPASNAALPPVAAFVFGSDALPAPAAHSAAFFLRPVRSTETLKRFRCAAVARLDALSVEAAARAAALESAILGALCERVLAVEPAVKAFARAVAVVDVSASLADLADEAALSRPLMTLTGVPVRAHGSSSCSSSGGSGSNGGPADDGAGELCLAGLRHLGVEDALWRTVAPPLPSVTPLEDGEDVVAEGSGSAPMPSEDGGIAGAPRHTAFVANDVVLGAPPSWLWAPESPGELDGGAAAPALPPAAAAALARARCVLLLGPNMGGKSTYLRSAAHAVVLAHVGAFVPARPGGRIGVCDALFARVGASDDLAAHRSTFMVEMQEMSDILRAATRSSLVVIDEVGRGTSVFDGLAIGLAVLEELAHGVGARTLFASHFPELAVTALPVPAAAAPAAAAGSAGAVRCMRMGWQHIDDSSSDGVVDGGGGIVVSHRVQLHPVHALTAADAALDAAGRLSPAALRGLGGSVSHGISVAQHAALPAPVITRARSVLAALAASGMPAAWATAVRGAAAPRQ